MVMNGGEVNDVLFGENGLVSTLKEGSAIILSATIKPSEAQALGEKLKNTKLHLIDTPESVGFLGAQNGTLTMMAAAPDAVLQKFQAVMGAVSANIHHVGTDAGVG